jgi:hypothetical protein
MTDELHEFTKWEKMEAEGPPPKEKKARIEQAETKELPSKEEEGKGKDQEVKGEQEVAPPPQTEEK